MLISQKKINYKFVVYTYTKKVFVFSTTSIIWLSVVFMLSCLRCFCFFFAPIDPLSFWLFFVFAIYGVGGSGWSALHINVLFLCFLFTFSNLCFFFLSPSFCFFSWGWFITFVRFTSPNFFIFIVIYVSKKSTCGTVHCC